MRCGQEHQGIERDVVHDSSIQTPKSIYIEIGHVIQFIVYSGPVLLRSNWKDSKNEGREIDTHTHVWLNKERERLFKWKLYREIPSSSLSFAHQAIQNQDQRVSLCFHASLVVLGRNQILIQSSLSYLVCIFSFRESPREQSNWNIRTEVLMEPNSTGNTMYKDRTPLYS